MSQQTICISCRTHLDHQASSKLWDVGWCKECKRYACSTIMTSVNLKVSESLSDSAISMLTEEDNTTLSYKMPYHWTLVTSNHNKRAEASVYHSTFHSYGSMWQFPKDSWPHDEEWRWICEVLLYREATEVKHLWAPMTQWQLSCT